MNPEEFIEYFVKTYKDHLKDGYYVPVDGKFPDLYPGYREAAIQRDEIAIHSTEKTFPREQFERLLQNMDPEGIDWIEDNYQAITHGVWNDFENTSARAIHNVRYEKKDVPDRVWEYLTMNLPKYQNINAYFKKIAPSLILLDGMGVFTVRPENLELEPVEGEEGVARIVGDIKPIPEFFECWRVLHYEEDKSCVIIRPEKSKVIYNKKETHMGFIFEFYTAERIERWVQTGKYVDWEFVIEWEYPHTLEKMPAIRTGGKPKIVENHLIYTSHFYAAVPNLNLAMHDNVFLTSVKRKCAFPTPVMISDECQFTSQKKGPCKGGWLEYRNDNGELVNEKCEACGGTGKSQTLNPFSTMFAPPKMRNSDHRFSAQDILSYVSPNPDVMKFLREEENENLSKAREEIKIMRSQGQDGHVTATERGIDHKATQQYIRQFTDVLVDDWNCVIQFIVGMGFTSEKYPTVLKPNVTDLKTEKDYMDEIGAAQEAQVPPIVLSKIIAEYLKSFYDGSYAGERMIETVMSADLIFAMGGLQAGVSQSNWEPWQIILHQASFSIVMNLMAEDPDWIDKKLQDRVFDVHEKAKSLVQENPSVRRLNGEQEAA